mmetsp:Transcript_31208/g.50698  ORF Transcript_31208/g.50698 Transcript_31208/m.50698 type:complete len:91 (+) Transcript_31208:205-477(+)
MIDRDKTVGEHRFTTANDKVMQMMMRRWPRQIAAETKSTQKKSNSPFKGWKTSSCKFFIAWTSLFWIFIGVRIVGRRGLLLICWWRTRVS